LRAERSVPVGDTSEEISALVLNYMISVSNYDAYLMVISDRCSWISTETSTTRQHEGWRELFEKRKGRSQSYDRDSATLGP
jgi:hypothetical protein